MRDCSWGLILMRDTFRGGTEILFWGIKFEGLLTRDTFEVVWGIVYEILLGFPIRALSYARVTQPSPRHFLHVCNLFVQGWPREMALSSENWNRNVWYWMIGLCIGRSLGAGIFKQGTFLLTISVCRPGLAERNSGRGIGGPSSKKTMMMTSRRKLNGLLRLFRHSHFMI